MLLACFELRYCNVEIYRGACFTAECFMKLATAKKKMSSNVRYFKCMPRESRSHRQEVLQTSNFVQDCN